MVWAIVLAAMVAMGIAAIAGTGSLGEMPPPVGDRPKPFFPDLPFGEEYLAGLRLPVVLNGYAREQVDELLAACASGEARLESLARARFDLVRSGYAMDAVDHLIDTLTAEATVPPEASPAEVSPEPLIVGDNRVVRTTEEIEDAHGSNEAPHW